MKAGDSVHLFGYTVRTGVPTLKLHFENSLWQGSEISAHNPSSVAVALTGRQLKTIDVALPRDHAARKRA